jgi:EAL domain-containing protein (putative c-di-GMP-specific phosphodiesterase class I)
LAEDTGLITDITNFVCRRALQQLKDWLPMGLARDLRLAINIAGADLKDGILASMLRQYTRAAGLPMSVLELEITESALMHSDTSATAVLTELQREGVRVAVDDFGTGYSSLARLQRLPVDVLKIDKVFVDDVGSGTRQSALARAIIIMAHSLGLTVVAEGVETADQYEFLRTHGCDTYQGYFLSRALPAEELSQLLGSLPLATQRLRVLDGGSTDQPVRVSPGISRRAMIGRPTVVARPQPR